MLRSSSVFLYGMSNKRVYLDYNATTPLSNAVLTVIQDALINAWNNPSSLSEDGKPG